VGFTIVGFQFPRATKLASIGNPLVVAILHQAIVIRLQGGAPSCRIKLAIHVDLSGSAIVGELQLPPSREYLVRGQGALGTEGLGVARVCLHDLLLLSIEIDLVIVGDCLHFLTRVGESGVLEDAINFLELFQLALTQIPVLRSQDGRHPITLLACATALEGQPPLLLGLSPEVVSLGRLAVAGLQIQIHHALCIYLSRIYS
jgi:hypothetical protein